MQPSEPLKPGETYLDEDLGIEVIVVESGGCSYLSRVVGSDAEKRINCAYYGRCEHVRGCVTPHPDPNVMYLPKLQYATFKLTQLVI
jgi:hypothetical protein